MRRFRRFPAGTGPGIAAGAGPGVRPRAAGEEAAPADPLALSGDPFPGETLTATGGSGSRQWYVDDVLVAGATAETFVVGILEAGATVKCVRGADDVSDVIWHPRDLGMAGGRGMALMPKGILNAASGEAELGEAVATWNDESGNDYHFAQGTEINRPVVVVADASGQRFVSFDGVGDVLLAGSGLGIFNARARGYIFAAVKDALPTGDPASHATVFASTNATAARGALYTRFTGNTFAAVGRQADAAAVASATAGNDNDWHALTAEHLWTSGAVRIRKDAAQVGTGTYAASGNSSATNSGSIGVGGSPGGAMFPGLVGCVLIIAPSVALTTDQIAEAERFCGIVAGTISVPAPTNQPAAITPEAQATAAMDNASWSQWVWPKFVEIPGDLLVSSTVKRGIPPVTPGGAKTMGSMRVMSSTGGAAWTGADTMPILYSGSPLVPAQLDWTADDHNTGCVIPDLRGGATYPLTVIQNDHGGPNGGRIARTSTADPLLFGAPAFLTAIVAESTYGMGARNPNNLSEIVYFYRQGESAAALWCVIKTTDEWATHTHRTLFGDGTGSEYFLAKQCRDGTGFHLVFHQHPISGTDQRITYAKLTWAGLLSTPTGGTKIADVFAADQTYGPFAAGNSDAIRTPAVGVSKRLHDFTETSSGILEVVWSEFTHGTDYTPIHSTYRHARYNTSTGAVVTDSYLDYAGFPQEVPAGANDYFCGATVLSTYDVIISIWSPGWTENHAAGTGIGYLIRMTSVDSGTTWTKTILEQALDTKFMRPELFAAFDSAHAYTPGTRYAVFVGTYSDFGTWDCEQRIYDVS